MLTTFWEKMGEGLAGQWAARAFTIAFAFWGGGLLTWAWRNGWDQVTLFLQTSDAITAGALLIAGIFVLAVSSALVNWLTLPVLRLAEGYWPGFMNRNSSRLIERVNHGALEKRLKLKALNQSYKTDTVNREETKQFTTLDGELDHIPVDARLRLPTRTGNILRAAEEYPDLHYGLEISTTWPRLWLVLPESTQKEIAESRQLLNDSARLLAWGALFIVWIVFAWWAIIPTLIVVAVAYWRMQSAAEVYALLLRSAYDLHRFELYKSLSLSLPTKPAFEKPQGQALTLYLKRHQISPNAYFVGTEKK
jgi:hypothetical protein